MPVVQEFKRQCIIEAKKGLLKGKCVTEKVTIVDPLMNLTARLIDDINTAQDTKPEDLYDDSWNWFKYIFHKGIAASIANRYNRANIDFEYTYEDAKLGKVPSYEISIIPVVGEYSFNLRYHLLKKEHLVEDYFNTIYEYVQRNIPQLEAPTEPVQILFEFLTSAAMLGIEFVNRINLTIEDYKAVKPYLIILDDHLQDNWDIEPGDHLGHYEEACLETRNNLTVTCSFCGEPALILPKKGDIWNDALFEPCEHFSFAFITNTDNQFHGREYYTSYLKTAVSHYVETFKGFTCDSSPEEFINALFNGDTDLTDGDIASILELLKADLPDCNIQIKQFIITLKRKRHVFVFHFMKLS